MKATDVNTLTDVDAPSYVGTPTDVDTPTYVGPEKISKCCINSCNKFVVGNVKALVEVFSQITVPCA